jgi:hypothetical protein
MSKMAQGQADHLKHQKPLCIAKINDKWISCSNAFQKNLIISRVILAHVK